MRRCFFKPTKMSHLGFLNCQNELFTCASFKCDGITLFSMQVSIQEEECGFPMLVPAAVIYQCAAVHCANKPCLLLASLKANIFVSSFPLFLNYTLNLRFGTDAIDPATMKAQVASRSPSNIFHCKVQYVHVNPAWLRDKRL